MASVRAAFECVLSDLAISLGIRAILTRSFVLQPAAERWRLGMGIPYVLSTSTQSM
jgi:hypothetical protein